MSSWPWAAMTRAGLLGFDLPVFEAAAEIFAVQQLCRWGADAWRSPPGGLRPGRRSALADVREDAVELIERVVADDDLALAGTAVLDLHGRAELFRQVVLQALTLGSSAFVLPSARRRRRRLREQARTSASVSRTESPFFATSAPTSTCWRRCSGRAGRAHGPSRVAPLDQGGDFVASSSSRSRLDTAARERPTASAAC